MSASAPWSSQARRSRFLTALQGWIQAEVDYIQLREKSLEAGEILELAEAAMEQLGKLPWETRPRLLVNGRPDVAAAARADGAHLTARPGELTPAQVRNVFDAAGLSRCLVSVSCHTLAGVAAARANGADLLLFGPVFEKRVDGTPVAEGTGVAQLHTAVCLAGPVPLLALGGVTAANAAQCTLAGAAGVAGIRLFDGERPERSVRK